MASVTYTISFNSNTSTCVKSLSGNNVTVSGDTSYISRANKINSVTMSVGVGRNSTDKWFARLVLAKNNNPNRNNPSEFLVVTGVESITSNDITILTKTKASNSSALTLHVGNSFASQKNEQNFGFNFSVDDLKNISNYYFFVYSVTANSNYNKHGSSILGDFQRSKGQTNIDLDNSYFSIKDTTDHKGHVTITVDFDYGVTPSISTTKYDFSFTINSIQNDTSYIKMEYSFTPSIPQNVNIPSGNIWLRATNGQYDYYMSDTTTISTSTSLKLCSPEETKTRASIYFKPSVGMGSYDSTSTYQFNITVGCAEGGTNITTGEYYHTYSISSKPTATIPSGIPAGVISDLFINIPKSRTGLAIGQYSTANSNTYKFECAYPAYFYNGLTIGNITISGSTLTVGNIVLNGSTGKITINGTEINTSGSGTNSGSGSGSESGSGSGNGGSDPSPSGADTPSGGDDSSSGTGGSGDNTGETGGNTGSETGSGSGSESGGIVGNTTTTTKTVNIYSGSYGSYSSLTPPDEIHRYYVSAEKYSSVPDSNPSFEFISDSNLPFYVNLGFQADATYTITALITWSDTSQS